MKKIFKKFGVGAVLLGTLALTNCLGTGNSGDTSNTSQTTVEDSTVVVTDEEALVALASAAENSQDLTKFGVRIVERTIFTRDEEDIEEYEERQTGRSFDAENELFHMFNATSRNEYYEGEFIPASYGDAYAYTEGKFYRSNFYQSADDFEQLGYVNEWTFSEVIDYFEVDYEIDITIHRLDFSQISTIVSSYPFTAVKQGERLTITVDADGFRIFNGVSIDYIITLVIENDVVTEFELVYGYDDNYSIFGEEVDGHYENFDAVYLTDDPYFDFSYLDDIEFIAE